MQRREISQMADVWIAPRVIMTGLVLATALMASAAIAHDIGGHDAAFVAATRGPAPGPFIYLGGKHMMTGIDHLLFLLGVIFFLRRFREVLLYVSLFALGHSITLLSGVLLGFGFNSFLVDAAIGLSVVYKAFDNVGGFETLLQRRPDPRWMVLGFGLVHGLGLATKLAALHLNREGLLVNLAAFNVGVEIGQVIALSLLLAALALWRKTRFFNSTALSANGIIMTAGFVLTGYHICGYILGGKS